MGLGMNFVEIMKDACSDIPDAAVLELGTKRSNEAVSTTHKDFAKDCAVYVGTDIEDGTDVDVVCDAHDLTEWFGRKFDVVISCSTFEHFKRLWIVAREIGLILKRGGIVFVQTHQTFPLHSYPSDYFRFSKEALESPFEGFETIARDYEFPCSIKSDVTKDTDKAFLNVVYIGRKK